MNKIINTIPKKNKLSPFGMVVKKKLLERGMTVSDLAKKVGMQQSYLSYILYDIRKGYKYKSKIMQILNIDQNLIDLAYKKYWEDY